jgi:hypothetical protein
VRRHVCRVRRAGFCARHRTRASAQTPFRLKFGGRICEGYWIHRVSVYTKAYTQRHTTVTSTAGGSLFVREGPANKPNTTVTKLHVHVHLHLEAHYVNHLAPASARCLVLYGIEHCWAHHASSRRACSYSAGDSAPIPSAVSRASSLAESCCCGSGAGGGDGGGGSCALPFFLKMLSQPEP